MHQLISHTTQTELKMKLLEVEGGHVPQCPIAGDATDIIPPAFVLVRTQMRTYTYCRRAF